MAIQPRPVPYLAALMHRGLVQRLEAPAAEHLAHVVPASARAVTVIVESHAGDLADLPGHG